MACPQEVHDLVFAELKDPKTLNAFKLINRRGLNTSDAARGTRLIIEGDEECQLWLAGKDRKSKSAANSPDRADVTRTSDKDVYQVLARRRAGHVQEIQEPSKYALGPRDLITQVTVRNLTRFDLLCKVLVKLPGVESIALEDCQCDMVQAPGIEAKAIWDFVKARVGNTGMVSPVDNAPENILTARDIHS